jgi:hypothetical protein
LSIRCSSMPNSSCSFRICLPESITVSTKNKVYRYYLQSRSFSLKRKIAYRNLSLA